jgi:hypothetical protein
MFRSNHSTLATWGGLERRLCLVLVSVMPANRTEPNQTTRDQNAMLSIAAFATPVASTTESVLPCTLFPKQRSAILRGIGAVPCQGDVGTVGE